MVISRADRKKALRTKLINAAEAQIETAGLTSVKARDLARDAGCALGAIYTAFADLNDLFMEVNGRTFAKLDAVVTASVVNNSTKGATERLIEMSHAYLDFAESNPFLWRALFDLQMNVDDRVPDWYLQALAGLFANISAPLSEIFPDMPKDELELMTRALFSSVHGIVLLGLEHRISGVPKEKLGYMISQILVQIGN